MRLEFRLHCSFDLFDFADNAFDFSTRGFIQQSNTRAGSCCIACRANFRQIAIGDKAQNHCIFHVNVAAERTRQCDAINVINTVVVKQ